MNKSDYDQSKNGKIKNGEEALTGKEPAKPRKTKKSNNTWIYVIFIITFILSIVMGLLSNILVSNLNLIAAIFILVVIVAIGIAFDMIGMSVASADEAPLHAKASKKHIGAKEAIKLVKYSEKVSSVCNDVVGDVCGVISGAVSAMLAVKIAKYLNFDDSVTSLILGAIVASVTVFGKAIGKTIASKNAEDILYKVGAIIHYVHPIKDKKKSREKI